MAMRDKVSQLMTNRAKRLRSKPTEAEITMLHILQSLDLPFKYQSPRWSKGIKRIFDFYIPYIKLIIEVDGGYHIPQKDKIKDTIILSKRRMSTLRFTNNEVLLYPTEVKQVITEAVCLLSKKMKRNSKREIYQKIKLFGMSSDSED